MSHSKCVLALAVLALTWTACPRQSTGPTTAEYQKQRAAAIERHKERAGSGTRRGPTRTAQATQDAESLGSGSSAQYAYDPIGKRDPFRSFILDRAKESDDMKGPLEQFDLSQLTVSGVVWETNRPRALILDPSGQNYIVREGDAIGKNEGRVITIDDSMVRVREAYVDFHGERTTKEIDMRVRQSQGG